MYLIVLLSVCKWSYSHELWLMEVQVACSTMGGEASNQYVPMESRVHLFYIAITSYYHKCVYTRTLIWYSPAMEFLKSLGNTGSPGLMALYNWYRAFVFSYAWVQVSNGPQPLVNGVVVYTVLTIL